MRERSWKLPRAVTVGALVVGIAGGSYGVASAASGSGSSTASAAPAASTRSNPSGKQRSDEALLTGDTAAKVRAAALARVSGGTTVRVETDADGHAAYEAHMTDASGDPVTVYVDPSFAVVSLESGVPGGHGAPSGAAPTA